MIIPLCQKTPADPILGTQWSMWVCLLTWDCLSHYNFHMAYKKMFNLVRWGVELKMNWLNWSIPISSGFQFQFNSNSKSFNSIPIQFMLNWIELIINSNSIHELIRALIINTNVDLSIWPHNGMKWKLGSIAFILENGLHNSGPGFIELTNLHQRSK